MRRGYGPPTQDAMKSNRTTQELSLAKIVTDARIEAAVDAYLGGSTANCFDLADSYTVNLTRAVRANRYAARALVDRRSSESVRRMIVRTAILLARPTKGQAAMAGLLP